jgi:hypothetical protein
LLLVLAERTENCVSAPARRTSYSAGYQQINMLSP